MSVPLLRRYYAGTGFFNVGYWADGARSQDVACRRLMHRLVNEVALHPRSILDVGCGTGATSAWLKERFPQADVTGVNISPWQISEARDRFPQCDFCIMDAAEMSLSSGKFDLVTCIEAAFLFSSRAAFLSEALRVLKPGGSLVASDILAGSTGLAASLVPIANKCDGPESYADVLRAVGFIDIRLADGTATCWEPYCQHIKEWIEGLKAGDREPAGGSALSIASTLLPVEHYLLVSARRPAT